MADFCNKCTEEMFGDNLPADIDVYDLAKGLPKGHYMPVICEGCGMLAISKTADGAIELGYEDKEGKIQFMQIKDWEDKKTHLINPKDEKGK